MYSQLIPIIAPVLLCAVIGYGWARSGLPFEREFVTRMIMNIGSPALILNGITNLDAQADEFAKIVLVAITVMLTCTAIGVLCLRLARQPLASFLPPVVFGNTGNLGLPLCLFAFGPEGLALAVGFYLVYAVTQFVFGPLVQGREPAWQTLVRTPMIYAALIGVALLTTGTQLPQSLENTVSLLGGLAIPLMLLALGHSLADFKSRGARRRHGRGIGPSVSGVCGWRRNRGHLRSDRDHARRNHHRKRDAAGCV